MARKNRDLESDFAPPDRMSMAKETVASDSSVTTGDITLLAVIYRELKTAAILINFLITAMMLGVVGPTMMSMEILLGVSTSQIALALVFGAVGYILGSVLAGLLYDRMNKELVFTLSLILMGASYGPAPFGRSLYAYIICLTLAATGIGMSESGGQSYIMTLWKGHRLKGPMTQMLQFLFGIGAAAGPLTAKSFLPDLNFLDQNCSSVPGNFTNKTHHLTISEEKNTSLPPCPNETEVTKFVASVRFAYVTVSVLVIIPMALFTLAFFLDTPSCLLRKAQKLDGTNQDAEEVKDKQLRLKLLVGGFILFFLYQPVEDSFGSFSAIFVVKGLGWPNGHGSLIASVFWAALCIGRLSGVPAAAFLSPERMLLGLLSGTVIGGALLIFSAYHDVFVWISATMVGLSIGPFNGTAFLWVSQYVNISGRVSAVFHVAVALGGMANPFIVGYLLDNCGHTSLPYYVTALTATFFITYLILDVIVRCHSRKKKNTDSASQIHARDLPKETEVTLLS